jgi:DNA-binding transcriptional ArsR family regulator
MKTIAKDTPLSEITLRRYEKPTHKGRDLVRKLCLSSGLLQPGDSRDVVVDVLHVLLKERRKGQQLSSSDVEKLVIEERKQNNLPQLGIASSNIRRQLKRLRDLLIIEKIGSNYRINENGLLEDIFSEKIEGFLLASIVSRAREYFRKIDEEF